MRECLESLMEQDMSSDSFEIIVVDDGSSDGTAGVVRSFVGEGPPRVRYLHQHYAGLSVARNRAINECGGDLICFLDDDAVASPGWLSAIVAAANRHPDVECFGGPVVLRLEGRAPRTCERESLGGSLDLGAEEQPTTLVKGGNMAIRRAAFARIGLFNPALVWRGDEDNWMRRFSDAGGCALYVPGALVWHRRTASDLRLWRLLKTRFAWGIGQIQFKRETGVAFSPYVELRALRSALGHAYRDRCTGGLLQASIKLGALWGGLFGELHKPRQSAPALSRPEDAP
jgi:glycosyltransferase involved in cell wall biosynthesis